LFGQAVVDNGTIFATYVNGDVAAWALPDLSVVAGMLAASPNTLSFGFTSGGAAPAAQTVNLFSNAEPLGFTISSDSAWLSASAEGVLTPSGLIIQADPTGLAPGSYTGSITATSADGSSIATISCTLEVSGSLPPLMTANFLSAATFLPQAAAPGGLFTLMAADLGGSINLASTPDLPTLLDGVSVSINGIPAPMVYVSPTQINAQVPFEVGSGPAMLELTKNGVPGQPVPISIASTAPQIFLTAATHAAAINQDYSLNAPANPAMAGGVISIFWTGQGVVNNPVMTGAPATALFLNTTVASTAATIGGQPATVLYSGLAPGFVGLAQVNLKIPDLPSGEYPVVLTVGSSTSNSATVSIKRQ
jgi:adhesin/invasin